MDRVLPDFRHHPDQLATGTVQRGDAVCSCCGEARGYVYLAGVYCEADVETLCHWCIADGSAAQRYGATFSDEYPLRQAGLREAVIAEVTERTPGFVSWQQEWWLSCCGDACSFHGDAPKAAMQALGDATRDRLAISTTLPRNTLDEIIGHHHPGGDPSFYEFRCRHCGTVHHGFDCS